MFSQKNVTAANLIPVNAKNALVKNLNKSQNKFLFSSIFSYISSTKNQLKMDLLINSPKKIVLEQRPLFNYSDSSLLCSFNTISREIEESNPMYIEESIETRDRANVILKEMANRN